MLQLGQDLAQRLDPGRQRGLLLLARGRRRLALGRWLATGRGELAAGSGTGSYAGLGRVEQLDG
jgi:hypothetical protein